jgi:branched-chain amino acid transport system permease protein
MSEVQLTAQIILNGLLSGAMIILFSIGLTLVFGMMNIINFAHGHLYMLGGYGTYFFFARGLIGSWGTDIERYVVAVVLSMLCVAVIGVLLERFLFRPFRGNLTSAFITAIGIVLILETGALVGFGIQDRAVPTVFEGVIPLFGASLSVERLSIICIGGVLLIGLYLFLYRTMTGIAMRAIAQDEDAARLQGINVNRLSAVGMGIGCGLAGAAGSLAASLLFVNPFMGYMPILKGFVVIIFGGLGSLPGTIIGGFTIGFIESIGGTFLGGDIANIIIFLVLIVTLIVRPQGLLGRPD